MRDLKIAYGNGRMAKFWSNKTMRFDELCERLRHPTYTTETVEEYAKMTKPNRDDIKDKGGFVAGHLRENRRQASKVECRSMLVYDLDNISKEFLESITTKIENTGCFYTTHSHTPKSPRARMVIPVSRDMTPDEFSAVARYYASDNGFINMLDPCSFSPHHLMFWPTCCSNGEYLFDTIDGKWLNPDDVLSAHPNWQDCSLLPTTPKESSIKKTNANKQKDPLQKSGIIGAFCRTYSIHEVIEKYLSDVYQESVVNGRYDYIPGESSAGVVIYDDKFSYSHHATDPACGKLLNAFDLVRIHKFYDENEKKSVSNMIEFALSDEEVNLTLVNEKKVDASKEFSDWKKAIRHDKSGTIENCLQNITLILQNDENLKSICFNELADSMEIKGEIPWKHPSRFWRDADDAQLVCYVDANYGSFSAHNFQVGVTKVVDDRSYHPIKQFLSKLPKWDGVPRVDSLLIDYLGAKDTPYTRTVTRKTLCAAVSRIKNPGIKFDHILVLNGNQGIGKSTLISKLGGQWYSDSLTLTDMNDKTAAEKLQGYWIIEIGELAGMKRADIDKVKAFISRQDDKYRASFGRRVTSHPRQCVFIGTTNSENGFLRDITGNRRFWAIKTTGTSIKKPWEITEEEIQQIWAEVVVLVENGEKLYLDLKLEEYSRIEQAASMEQDEREGIVIEYLNTLLPENWDNMSIYERRNYLNGNEFFGTTSKGCVKRTSVSNMEIWCECFGKSKEDLKVSDSYAISAIMLHIDGWHKTDERETLPIYGRQRLYKRDL